MEEALLHIQAAIDVLRRSAGPRAVLSTLEGAQASPMHDIFGTSLAPAPHRMLADWLESDWTLGPDEPLPHSGYGAASDLIGFGELDCGS
jgi:hypothetical protein